MKWIKKTSLKFFIIDALHFLVVLTIAVIVTKILYDMLYKFFGL